MKLIAFINGMSLTLWYYGFMGQKFRPAYDNIGGLRALTKAPFIHALLLLHLLRLGLKLASYRTTSPISEEFG